MQEPRHDLYIYQVLTKGYSWFIFISVNKFFRRRVMTIIKFSGCDLSSVAINGINNISTIPSNPGGQLITLSNNTITMQHLLNVNRIQGGVKINFQKSISLNIAEGHKIIVEKNDKDYELARGVYSEEDINKIVHIADLKPLIPLLDKIDFGSNKVNIKSLEKILINKKDLVDYIHKGKIEANEEQISKLNTLEADTYANMHKMFLIWKEAQFDNIANDMNNGASLASLPGELISIIFSYIPLTGEDSIQSKEILGEDIL
ncbi:MAG: hypothetical protein K0Q51_338 [Rickettsiaceae bacterium]|jgi:hypothetical protein|nr:hypothetical protein [Rickettsiaceae bacterium]